MMIETQAQAENTAFTTVSFKCTICGKCCNSAPLMTVAELFHHEKLFIGCLALRRIKRHKAGAVLHVQQLKHTVSHADTKLLDDLAQSQLYQTIQMQTQGDYYFSIMTQAMDYESLNKCPALGENNYCTIHNDRKPNVCSVVPFDALYPDSLQNIVLLSRGFAENCIVNGLKADFEVVVKDRQVQNYEYLKALRQRRDDLHFEKQLWGNTVFALLQAEGYCHSGEAAKAPWDDALLSLSIIPVLMVVAGVSEKCADRCLQYIDSQLDLLEQKINQALSRKSAVDKPTTQVFRAFKHHYMKFRSQLLTERIADQHYSLESDSACWIKSVENYLGL